MKAHIVSSIDELNGLIAGKKKVDIKFHSQVVGFDKDASGVNQPIVLDRFLVLTDEK